MLSLINKVVINILKMSKTSNNLKHDSAKRNTIRSKSATSVNKSNIALIITDYQQKLRSYFLQTNCNVVPNIRVYEENKENAVIQEQQHSTIPFVDIILKTGRQEEAIDKIVYKNSAIETAVLISIQTCFGDKIAVLKLQFCQLTCDQIQILSDFLHTNYTVKEVNINGNPTKEQNYYLLLEDTNIINLSVRFCSIDCHGIEKLISPLCTPFDNKLLHLNLSSNLLFDEGMDYIASFLRINRTLISLNLADNKIRDGGCAKLMEPLQKFPLTHDEIVSRRRMKFDIYQKNENKISNETSNSKRNLTNKNFSEETLLNIPINSKSDTLNNLKTNAEYHPLIQDCFEENKEVYCKGNNILTNLNLSYNRIRKQGLDSIIEMLRYQKNSHGSIVLSHNDRGISRISVEGNDFYGCLYELNEMEGLLNKKLMTQLEISVKSQTSIKKKTSRMSTSGI